MVWSHCFCVRRPYYNEQKLPLQARTGYAYDEKGNRSYIGISQMHPSYALDQVARVEFSRCAPTACEIQKCRHRPEQVQEIRCTTKQKPLQETREQLKVAKQQ
jgi:hypothetical protein